MNRVDADQTLPQAINLQQQGHLVEAEKFYRQILVHTPRHAPTLHFLGLLLHQRNQYAEANQLMRRALEIAPDNEVFLSNFARALIAQGKTQQALPIFQQWLDLNPRNAEGWHELGLAVSHLGGKEQAVDCWQRALTADPRLKAASLSLGETLAEMSFWEEAEAVYRSALQYSPQDMELHCAFAQLLAEMGRADEALSLLGESSPVSAEQPGICYTRGIVQVTLGRFEEAAISFRKTIKLMPDFYRAHVHLTAITRITLDDTLYRGMEEIAHTGQIGDTGQQANVHFSLGKILQDNRQFDHAFEHFTAGNGACRILRPYSHARERKNAETLKTLINRRFIDSMHAYGNPTSLPVFILGMPRSGTTLTEQVLARHPEVQSGGEMILLHAILRRTLGSRYRQDFASSLAALSLDAVSAITKQLETGLRNQAGKAARLTDKMPSNFLIAGWLHALFPNARIVHCRRDPLDTCVSCYTTLFSHGHEFASSLEDLGQYYRLYQDVMAHWRGLLPSERFFELDYETLVADPEPVVRQLLDFVGLPWHPDCLRFGETSNTVQSASALQVRQPLYTSSVGRWRHYARHLAPLRIALGISG